MKVEARASARGGHENEWALKVSMEEVEARQWSVRRQVNLCVGGQKVRRIGGGDSQPAPCRSERRVAPAYHGFNPRGDNGALLYETMRDNEPAEGKRIGTSQ